jgi:hypothetical protein
LSEAKSGVSLAYTSALPHAEAPIPDFASLNPGYDGVVGCRNRRYHKRRTTATMQAGRLAFGRYAFLPSSLHQNAVAS